MKCIAYFWTWVVLQVPLVFSVAAMEVNDKTTETYVRQHPYFHNVNEEEAKDILTNSPRGNVLFCNANSSYEFLVVYLAVFNFHQQLHSLKLTCNEDLGSITHHAFGDCPTLTATLSALQKWLKGFAVFIPHPILNPKPHESWSKFDNLEAAIEQDHEDKMNLASTNDIRKSSCGE